jgi:hypothetical protein
MAGIHSSSPGAAPLSPSPEPPAAEGHGGGAADDDDDNNDNTFFPLLDLLQRFPDLFAQKVLAHLAPIDRTFLAQTEGACRAAVAVSDLPRAGTRGVVLGKHVWVVRHNISEFCTSVERLAWAKANGCPWVYLTCELAAGGGRLEALQWAREQDCPWDTGTCASAAEGGHLEVLRWAREHHCFWDIWTCYKAAARGHLEVLKWAREHGCPWVKRQCAAASYNHPQTLAWVRAQP